MQTFKIAFIGLKPGEHDFKFNIDQQFFVKFEQSPIQQAEIEINVKLDKKNSFMTLMFQIDGYVKTICDRCSDEFSLELMDDHRIYFKFDDLLSVNYGAENDDVVYLKRNDTHIELDQFFYELILLSLPLKKACQLNESQKPSCGKKIYSYFTTQAEEEIKNTPISDPRWEALKKLNK